VRRRAQDRRRVRHTAAALAGVKSALEDAGVEMPADIVALQGTPSLKAALRDDDTDTTQAGGVRRRLHSEGI